MLSLRNPGLYSVLIFLCASALIVFLVRSGAAIPDSLKVVSDIGALVAVAAAAFAGKSALVVDPNRRKTDPPPPLPPPRAPMRTWPDTEEDEEPTKVSR